MKQNWLEILVIWSLVVIGAIVAVSNLGKADVFGVFALLLAGSLALVSLGQLFRAGPSGFVRRLVFVGGGSYAILLVATLAIWLRG
ncbi:MAG: hypothetical protein ACKOWJ_00865 [Micrococcales bacterium]